ncbi:hypothetical protein CC1G_14131 [Coprinopsis cinerea okayama7|uniref:Uncharacterized protein n=1 Tax=Coprinopsis cinerea (strain Okayama-7 / 130 / ATCC MYA-4618 / FGSC 9003) TaxID=240176 RepID=D6RLB6_COPC7|nr:hypothetical protein CC1G_14131 [Coprinopsis cinerea okayama7\|eukprot:XP_002911598.1 hypothetical protein CC1G_14131 [Coprinopsis cinerea okayama7\
MPEGHKRAETGRGGREDEYERDAPRSSIERPSGVSAKPEPREDFVRRFPAFELASLPGRVA